MEQNIETLGDEDYSKGVFMENAINRRDYHNSVYNTDTDDIDPNSYQAHGEGRRGDTVQSAAYTEVFRIEDRINVYVGIWGTSLCTDNIIYCVDLDTEVAHNVLSSMRSLKQIQGESMYQF